MKNRYVVIGCMVGSLGLLAWLLVGSLVTYAPSVSAMDIQNRYIEHIFWFGGAALLLQIVALAFASMKSP